MVRSGSTAIGSTARIVSRTLMPAMKERAKSIGVVIWIDPYEDSLGKFNDVLVKGVGLTVITVSTKPTSFPSIVASAEHGALPHAEPGEHDHLPPEQRPLP